MSTEIPRMIQARTRSGKSFYIEVESRSSGALEPAGHDPAADPPDAPGPDSEVSRSGDVTRSGDSDLFQGGDAQGSSRVLRTDLFVKAVDVLRDVSQEVTNGLLASDPRPSKVQLSLDLGFDAGGNVWILKGGARATMRLMLEWALPDENTADADR